VEPSPDDRFGPWFQALETRHLSRLTFGEVRRGLQALSSLYVERRGRLGAGEALDGSGKRAAFALFYGPLHFLLVRDIVRALEAGATAPHVIVDLGCGTGAAGAAWAIEGGGGCRVAGIDRSGWAIEEARWNYRVLGLRGTAVRGDVMGALLPGRGGAILASFTLNEIEKEARAALRDRLLCAGRLGAAVLVVEPIARRPIPWWEEWSTAFRDAGGRDDEWRFAPDLPERLRLFDRAARLDHALLTGRSLFLPGAAGSGKARREPISA
jgi:SAM-dependent methyltransferase